ncbi:MAG: type IIS restriction enzyme Eco57I (endonuclease Eco57I) [Candidatus Saganbacteria bacterium]|uniref:site-specific DNA-methyltransferase (adenine-specific) n=1 Tax=Candidatus Saganbacteria bacterium TaxID=2575572 RepID=A0A833KZJ6_UNCSA|nr:MAG: type IIS restriction enzyme Eco57I (endonuclease Eco57I) [Candidatus Saganbacteria bacterium]
MPAPKQIIELVERFERNLEEYKSGRYNETQLRREFLDPFFEALGWDVNNKQGHAPAYRDVTHEDRLSVGEWTKSPDYCFRVGKERKFFLEAKKPSVNVKEDISPAYQLRRYAWSAKLSLSILSDFEEFAVYDCRIKPIKTNGAKVARIIYFTYKDYVEKWDEIAGIFSREAVLKGSFDKYAESGKKKRGTAEVDEEFLKEIESWRELLAKNIADNNPKLSTRELNYAVQSTIDRIIFLRICEDRRIEDYARLMALQNGDNTYPRLCELFRQADDKYNSGLFHFSEEKGRTGHPDSLSLKLKIDDKPIKEIIKGLYYPDSPYQFDYMPIEILGQVYEQFLGKVIHLTESHRAVIEEKPEVRKAGGVYYTPKYIVDYIVKNTVGKLLEGKNPKQAAKIKILDPACGSGSFLIGAYQYLLDWHREWYVNDGALEWAKKKSPALYQDTQGEW